MTSGRVRTPFASLLAAILVLGACSSGSDDASSTTRASPSSPSTSSTGDGAADGAAGGTTVAPPTTPPAATDPDTTAPGGTTALPTSTAATFSPQESTTTIVVTLPDDDVDADVLVLSDEFEDGDDDVWGESTWTVDVPGEATATVIDGVGVMATDARGTHEWVRAVAPGSTHDDATLTAVVTPIESSEGTVFVGLHGDGEWRDIAPYLPQTGVVVEYSYADVFLGEVVLIVLDGPDEQRIGPVAGPILEDGESAIVRLEVVDGVARAKVWRVGAAEPAGWMVEVATPTSDGGVVQISYRDGVAQSVAWDELTLQLRP